ncbi:MAG: DNA cytosine methyltransferase [Pseudomonadota bacterium]
MATNLSGQLSKSGLKLTPKLLLISAIAGYTHQGAYELIPICGETLKSNRPNWIIHSGPENGEVTQVVWQDYIGSIDVIHGGPPCQPFSIAGQQAGQNDERNMWGEFIRAVNTHIPKSFVAENVLGILNPKFSGRNTTSVLNSTAGQKAWGNLGIWPNGAAVIEKKHLLFRQKTIISDYQYKIVLYCKDSQKIGVLRVLFIKC